VDEKTDRDPPVDQRWDAGHLGCGYLVFELFRRMKTLPPGGRIEVTSLDEGAPVDFPAWCRSTGHVLESARHPVYRIRKRPD